MKLMFVVIFTRLFEVGVFHGNLVVDCGDTGVYPCFFFRRMLAFIEEIIDLVEFELFAERIVRSGFFRLFGQRLDLSFEFWRDIDDTADIVARSVKFTHRFEPFRLCLGNAYRLFEYSSSVFGFGRKYFRNLALTDYGIPFFTYTAFVQCVDYIAKSSRSFIDIVFAFARTEQFTGKNDFVEVDVLEYSRGIIEGKRNFTVRQRFSVLRSVENNVLHAAAAHCFCGHFAENPAYGVGDVTFTATVRSDYTGYSVIESDFLFIGERFETDKFDFFEIHLLLLKFSVFWRLGIFRNRFAFECFQALLPSPTDISFPSSVNATTNVGE